MKKSELKKLIKEELETLLVGRYTGVKLNMRKILKNLKNNGYNPESVRGNKIIGIESIIVGGIGDDGDYGTIEITQNGEVFGENFFGTEIESEDEVIPTLEKFIKYQKKHNKP